VAAAPLPKCSDPNGYYGELLARIKAAGDNARSASGLGGIQLALAPLKSVKGNQQEAGPRARPHGRQEALTRCERPAGRLLQNIKHG
jgi:hypothetical protein